MSTDLEKLASAGEWTAVDGDLNTGTTEIFQLGRRRAKIIADAHNAALQLVRRSALDEGQRAVAEKGKEALELNGHLRDQIDKLTAQLSAAKVDDGWKGAGGYLLARLSDAKGFLADNKKPAMPEEGRAQ